jgi:hypothetical protein
MNRRLALVGGSRGLQAPEKLAKARPLGPDTLEIPLDDRFIRHCLAPEVLLRA